MPSSILVFVVPDEEVRTLMPTLPTLSGGFADRLKGLLFAIEWSCQTNTKLLVYWKKPIPIDQIFTIRNPGIQAISITELRDLVATHNNQITIANFLDKRADEINQLKSENDLRCASLTVLVNNQFHAPSPSERKLRLRSAFQNNLSFNRLITDRAKSLCPLIGDPRCEPLLGLQLRIGKHVGSQWTDPFLDSKLNWKLLRKVGKHVGADCKNFIFMSDAGPLQFDTVHAGLMRFRPHWGANNHHFELSKHSATDTIVDTLAQFYILTCCEQIVHGKGEFGYLAAAIGRGDATDYYQALSPGYKRLHKWNHRLSRWRISLNKRLK